MSIDPAGLRPGFSGELLTAADGSRYDAARAVFNAMFDRRPDLIARPSNTQDVALALAFARSRNVALAIRAGGHSVAGYSSIDGGLLIDLGAMRSVRVDAGARRARVQPGANWGEVDEQTQAFGLATTGGRVTSTGVAGFTLGSGSGWLERLHGLSCDNLISAEVVTADGKVLRASNEQNEELFWGLRGGGGNFGIVTDFEFQLHPVGPMVLAGLLLHPRDKAPEVFRYYREYMADAPREVSGGIVLLHAPPAPFVPTELQGRPAVAIVAAYFGPIERGTSVLAPLRAFGSPPVDIVQPMPYCAFQSLLDAGNPPGRRNYWRSENLGTLPDEAIDAYIACAATATSPFSVMILQRFGGAVSDVAEEATPLGGRTAPWQYHCYGVWTEPDDARHIAWVRATEQAMRPWSSGRVSLNFVSEPNDERVRSSFGPEKYRRLVALKNEYDPDNVFSRNQNIPPGARR
jgi:FAD/FMN-containing dehydrogenase